MIFFGFIVVAAGASANVYAPAIRKVQLNDDTRTVTLKLAPNAITSIRFNRPLDQEKLVCGDNQSFILAAQGDRQLNAKAATADTRASTNCNLYTAGGVPVILRLQVVDRAKADAFVEAEFTGQDPAPAAGAAEAELSKRMQTIIDDKVFTAVKECEAKSSQGLATLAADAIVTRRLNERAVQADVVLAVRDFIKIGSRGVIRFSIENRSRDSWAAGSAKLTFIAPGQEQIGLEVTTSFKTPVADRGEEVFAAITFDMYQLPENARFTLQILERNGSRHPSVSGIRL